MTLPHLKVDSGESVSDCEGVRSVRPSPSTHTCKVTPEEFDVQKRITMEVNSAESIKFTLSKQAKSVSTRPSIIEHLL